MGIGGLDAGARAVIGLSVVAAVLIVVAECAPKDAPPPAKSSPTVSAAPSPAATPSPSASASASITDKDAKAALLRISDLPTGWSAAAIDFVPATFSGSGSYCSDLGLAFHTSKIDGSIAAGDTNYVSGKQASPASTAHEAINAFGSAREASAFADKVKAAAACKQVTATAGGHDTTYTVTLLPAGSDGQISVILKPTSPADARPSYLDVTVVGTAVVVLELDGAIVNSGGAADLHSKAISRAKAALAS